MFYRKSYPSPIGELILVCHDRALVRLCLPGQYPAEEAGAGEHPILTQTERWLDCYFRGEDPGPAELPLAAEGTAFQMLVWKLLTEIPYGTTVTYGNIAQKAALILGKPHMSAQAVGQAVGKNPIAILVPCHRCLGAKGQMTGYAWGIDKKQWLLAHEEETK